MRVWLLAAVIGAGLLSRYIHSGSILVDKYLGDSLYAVMIYLLLPAGGTGRRAGAAMVIMSAIEVFQLTGIPAQMTGSGVMLLRLTGRLLGTVFSWTDLLAYAVGIGAVAGWDSQQIHASKGRARRVKPHHPID